jgi:hypothetical protein
MDLIENDDSGVQAPPSTEELSDFKAQVAEWVKIDDQVKRLRVATRERLVHQKALGLRIQEFMKKFNYDDLHTQQGRIKNSVREVKAPLKITDVKTQLYTIMDEHKFNDETVKKIHDIFDRDRPLVKKEGLKRDTPKVSLQLDL